ncbi:Pseudouridine synthase [Nitrospirillum viridazoti Y2]|nr:Pseudouridine synthase [Nitrospirillum amazonense Y2]
MNAAADTGLQRRDGGTAGRCHQGHAAAALQHAVARHLDRRGGDQGPGQSAQHGRQEDAEYQPAQRERHPRHAVELVRVRRPEGGGGGTHKGDRYDGKQTSLVRKFIRKGKVREDDGK